MSRYLVRAAVAALLVAGCGSSALSPGDGSVASDATSALDGADAATTGFGNADGSTTGGSVDAALADGPIAPDGPPASDLPATIDMVAGSARINIMPTVFSFPTTTVGNDSPVTSFVLTNIGTDTTGPISHTIEGVNGGEFIIVASTCAQPLVPMATCQVAVTFRPLAAGQKSARLTASATPGDSFSVLLNGFSPPVDGGGPAKIALTPTAQSFGQVPLGKKSVFTFDVTNTGGAVAGQIGLSLEGPNFAAFSAVADAGCHDPLKPGFSCTIIVTFEPTTLGPQSAALVVTASPGGVARADLTGIGLTGTTQAMISLQPATADPFGAVALGDSRSSSFLLKNVGTAAVGKAAASIRGSSNEFIITDNGCPDTLGAGAMCTLTVKFTPTVIGRRNASLQVLVPPGAFATLPLTGVGTK